MDAKRLRGSVIMTDTESRILFASEDVRERTGFDVAETVGRRPSELWGGRMSAAFYRQMWTRLAKGLPYAESILNRRKNGETLESALSIAPVRDERGNIAAYLALQPDDEAGFREEFFLASVAEADPARMQRLLETRFDWDAGEIVQTRAGLLERLRQTLVEPMRLRFRARTDDAELVRRAKSDGEAFGELVAKYHGVLRRYFRFRLADPERAEELVQETFERAFRALATFRPGPASYQTYLLRIAHNLLVSEYRRSEPAPVLDPEADRTWLDRLEARDEVMRAMRELPPSDQEVLHRFYQEGYSVREISEQARISENAVKLRLSRARHRLERAIAREEEGVV